MNNKLRIKTVRSVTQSVELTGDDILQLLKDKGVVPPEGGRASAVVKVPYGYEGGDQIAISRDSPVAVEWEYEECEEES